MFLDSPARRWRQRAASLASTLVVGLVPVSAHAQGFISPTFGYNFAGDAGCRSATDCQNKNWNWGGSVGALGSVVGFEAELTYEGKFTGDRPNPTAVTTVMGNFMLAPRFGVVQPYGLAGLGAIRTHAQDVIEPPNARTQIGWTIGGGVLIFVQEHVGLKGDVRYYHSFQALDLLGIDLARDQNKVDFGRAAFGVLFKF